MKGALLNLVVLGDLKPLEKTLYLYLLAWVKGGEAEGRVRLTRLHIEQRLGIDRKRLWDAHGLSELEQLGLLRFNDPLDGVERRDAKTMLDAEVAAFIRANGLLSGEELAAALGVRREELYQRGDKSPAVKTALQRRPQKGQGVLNLTVYSAARPDGYRGRKEPLDKAFLEATSDSPTTKAVYLYLRGVSGEKTVKEVQEVLGIRRVSANDMLMSLVALGYAERFGN